jgi:ABC-type transport system involved in multi-copper enzyme maturation permease subunit
MFCALYCKEWKEKRPLVLFELAILVLLLLSHFAISGKRDLQESLMYAVLLLFFPFSALVLGTTGFESEFRQGAWAYLFSRPVRKSAIWLAKYAALMSMLAALWLTFLVAWLVFPELKGLAGGPRVLIGFSIQTAFPFWSCWQTVFLLTVAFSMSVLHEKQLNLLFLSLVLGLGLTAAVWALLNLGVSGHMAREAPSKALSTFVIAQVLIAMAIAAASILTLLRSDYSQPRRQSLDFARWAAPFLVMALVGAAGWTALTPLPGERFLSFLASDRGEPYFVTERGIFKYAVPTNRVEWVVKAKSINAFTAAVASGKIAYTGLITRSRQEDAEELWVANSAGSGRKLVIGRGPRAAEWPQKVPMADLMISPDGQKIAILAASAYGKQPRQSPPLWIVSADGTQLDHVPWDLALALFGNPAERYAFHLVAWAPDGNGVLILRRNFAKQTAYSLWLYDLAGRAARLVLDNALAASWGSSVSPGGDCLAIKYQKNPEKPWTLALLDLKTLGTTDILDTTLDTTGEPVRVLHQISWSPKGDRLAYVVRKPQAGGPDVYLLAVYSLAEKKTIAERAMTKSESSALLLSPAWTADGAKLLILDREANGLKVLGPDLREEDRVAFPAWMKVPVELCVAGDQALVKDDAINALWRLNLGDKTWKRVY